MYVSIYVIYIGQYYCDTGFVLKAGAKEIFPLKGTMILNQLSC